MAFNEAEKSLVYYNDLLSVFNITEIYYNHIIVYIKRNFCFYSSPFPLNHSVKGQPSKVKAVSLSHTLWMPVIFPSLPKYMTSTTSQWPYFGGSEGGTKRNELVSSLKINFTINNFRHLLPLI
jgi:hypothetical protein